MPVTVLIIGLGLVLVCGVSATLNLALRHLSRAGLARALEARRREHWLETYRQYHDGFILATATLRMISALGLVLIVVELCGERLSQHAALYYGKVSVIAACLVLLCGLAIPQPCAKYLGPGLLSHLLPLLRVMDWITKPVSVGLRLFDGLVRRLAGIPKLDEHAEFEQIEQEVLNAVHEAELQGAVDQEEKDMITSVMELDQTTAGEIMTPRTAVVAISKDASLAELKGLIKREGHSRIPVYEETIDRVLGMVYAKDLLQVDENGKFHLAEHIREVPFVPASKSLSELLREFRTGKTHAAIVLDEYGGTAGLVTIEDILEELVGEIADEYEQPEPQPIRQLSDDVFEADSKVYVYEINEMLQVNIPESDDYETLGGFVFSTLGKIPERGEQLVHDNARITVLDATDRKINRLRIELLPQPSGA